MLTGDPKVSRHMFADWTNECLYIDAHFHVYLNLQYGAALCAPSRALGMSSSCPVRGGRQPVWETEVAWCWSAGAVQRQQTGRRWSPG